MSIDELYEQFDKICCMHSIGDIAKEEIWNLFISEIEEMW